MTLGPTLSYYAGSIDLLVLPRISSKRSGSPEPAGRAPLLPDVIGMSAAPPAPDVSSFSPSLAE